MKFSKIIIVSAVVWLSFPVVQAHALQNKVKQLHAQMNKCEKTAKKYSALGYPAKADKQLQSCKKIKNQLAKIKQGQAKVGRKIASLDAKPKKKHSKKKAKKKSHKHHKAAPAPAADEPAAQ